MNKIPEDLAGYQHIVTGKVQQGDVLVRPATRAKFFAPFNEWGLDVEDCLFDVYRKMDVPRHDAQTLPAFHPGDFIRVPADYPQADLKAKTDDSKKAPLAKLPWKALRAVSGVQQYGHQKYGDYYNYKAGMEVSRNLSCAIRHISEYMDGNDNDKESGQSHLAHAACRILFALENLADGKAIDDRYHQKTK